MTSQLNLRGLKNLLSGGSLLARMDGRMQTWSGISYEGNTTPMQLDGWNDYTPNAPVHPNNFRCLGAAGGAPPNGSDHRRSVSM